MVKITVTFCLLVWVVARSAAGQAADPSPNTAPNSPEERKAAITSPSTNALSPGAVEIVKMSEAGVSVDVIKTYVESSPKVFEPTHEDIIALSQRKVPDEITTLVVKRAAQARVALNKAKNEAVARVQSDRKMAGGGLDPDSYAYFQYYYLQPRALASANDRLYRFRNHHAFSWYGPHF